MLKEGDMLHSNTGEHVTLRKYYINFCGQWIGMILASNQEKATVRSQSYLLGKEIKIGNNVVEINESMIQYVIAMTELEYKELVLPIEDIFEDFI
jgi:hypothetical protein